MLFDIGRERELKSKKGVNTSRPCFTTQCLQGFILVRLQFIHFFVRFYRLCVFRLFEEAAGDLALDPAGFALAFGELFVEMVVCFLTVESRKQPISLT